MSISPAQQAALSLGAETTRVRLDARIEDLEFLLSTGVRVEEAVSRAGWPSLSAAERALHRRGRRDLARAIHPAVYAARRAA